MLQQKHVFMGFGLLLCIVPLYWAKTKADYMRENMQNLHKDVQEEQRKISELEAQLAYLSRFDRIEGAATKLGMKPIDGSQIKDIAQLELVAPLNVPERTTIVPQYENANEGTLDKSEPGQKIITNTVANTNGAKKFENAIEAAGVAR